MTRALKEAAVAAAMLLIAVCMLAASPPGEWVPDQTQAMREDPAVTVAVVAVDLVVQAPAPAAVVVVSDTGEWATEAAAKLSAAPEAIREGAGVQAEKRWRAWCRAAAV